MAPLLARIDPELIIWGIVVIFWVIAQVLSKVKDFGKGQQSRPAPARPHDPTGRPSVENELRDFLENLTGYSKEEEEEEEEEEAWHPRSVQEPKPVIRLDPPTVVAPIVKRDPLPQRFRDSVDLPEYVAKDIQAIKEITDIVETMHLKHESTVSGRALLQMPVLHIKTLAMPAYRTNHHDHPTKPPRFKNRRAFRDAVIGQIVLGPCKAMEKPEA